MCVWEKKMLQAAQGVLHLDIDVALSHTCVISQAGLCNGWKKNALQIKFGTCNGFDASAGCYGG